MACNVADGSQVEQLIAATRERLGPIDLLAHCGAISNIADHQELTFDRWFETIDVNLNGAFRMVFAVKDEMLDRRFGRIVLLSSVAALRPRAKQIHYASAKAGVIALAPAAAKRLPRMFELTALHWLDRYRDGDRVSARDARPDYTRHSIETTRTPRGNRGIGLFPVE